MLNLYFFNSIIGCLKNYIEQGRQFTFVDCKLNSFIEQLVFNVLCRSYSTLDKKKLLTNTYLINVNILSDIMQLNSNF